MTNQRQQATDSSFILPVILMFVALALVLGFLLSNMDGEPGGGQAAAFGPSPTHTPRVLEQTSTPRPPTNTPTPIVLPGNLSEREASNTPTPLALSSTAQEATVTSTRVAPTTLPTSGPSTSSGSAPSGDVPPGDPANGEALFNTFQPLAGFACGNCHLPNSEAQLVGPGLLNVGTRAASRVPGLNAQEYITQSIKEPGAYVVEGFVDNLMPRNFADIFTDQQINDLVAYLMSLQG